MPLVSDQDREVVSIRGVFMSATTTTDPQPRSAAALLLHVQGKQLVSLAAAKRHTVVLTADGDVYTWGHRVVTPRRVGLAGARDVSRASAAAPPLAFHKGQTDVSRPRAVRIAAGAAHTSCLTQVHTAPAGL